MNRRFDLDEKIDPGDNVSHIDKPTPVHFKTESSHSPV